MGCAILAGLAICRWANLAVKPEQKEEKPKNKECSGDATGSNSPAKTSQESVIGSHASSLCEPGAYKPYETEIEFLRNLSGIVRDKSAEIQSLPVLFDSKNNPGRALRTLKENIHELDRELERLQRDIEIWREDARNWQFGKDKLPKFEEILQLAHDRVSQLPYIQVLREMVIKLEKPKMHPRRTSRFKAQFVKAAEDVREAAIASHDFRIKLVKTTLKPRTAYAASRNASAEQILSQRPGIGRHSTTSLITQKAMLRPRPPAVHLSTTSSLHVCVSASATAEFPEQQNPVEVRSETSVRVDTPNLSGSGVDAQQQTKDIEQKSTDQQQAGN